MNKKQKFFIENVTMETVLFDIKSIKGDLIKGGKTKSYIFSYREFIKYFRDLNIIIKHNVVIGINFSYGWMPRIFEFKSEIDNEIIEILNKAKQGKSLNENELKKLRSCFNNSCVGMSKLLHFINPNVFAIWDSHIYSYLTKKSKKLSSKTDVKEYLEYLNLCKEITEKKKYSEIHKLIVDNVGYDMTKYRTFELAIFLISKNKKVR